MNPETGVTVVLISRGHLPSLTVSLESLSKQSLLRSDFQTVIVPVAIEDSSFGSLLTCSKDYRYINTDVVGGALEDTVLWRAVTRKIRFSQVIFLWEGDSVSPGFLEALLNAAVDGEVPLAQIVEAVDNREECDSWYNQAVLDEATSPTVKPSHQGEFLGEIAARMVPVRWLDERVFAYVLNSEAFLFNAALAGQHSFVFSRFPAVVGAKYYRTFENRVMISHKSRDLDSTGVYEMLEKLWHLGESLPKYVQKGVITTAQTCLIEIAKEQLSQSDVSTLFRELADSGLRGLSWELFEESTDTLAIIANFPPYSGTAGIVAAKRIVEKGTRVDVISSVMSSRAKHEEDLLVTEPYVRRHKILTPDLRALNDRQIRGFIDGGLDTLQEWQSNGEHYTTMYSRSMMPYSHFLAAAIKRVNYALHWVAEFSDPNSLDVEGNIRASTFKSDAVTSLFSGMGTRRQQELLNGDRKIYRWAELLPYFFADELIFTNENQLEIMLDYAPAGYRETIRDKARVRQHPTLPSGYYRLARTKLIGHEGKIKLAYFGDFYKTRGMGELIEALESLSDDELDAFRLLVFTGSKPDVIHDRFSPRMNRILDVQPRVDYLTFLATLDEMDCLIVNDSHSKDYFKRNPYLPSKVSDYQGSATPIWAIVEPDSSLSTMEFSYKSELGDISGAVSVLNKLKEDTLL